MQYGPGNVAALLATFGVTPEAAMHDEWHLVHRLAYIAQAARMPLGYSHRWSGSGPWSAELQNHLREAIDRERGGLAVRTKVRGAYGAAVRRVLMILVVQPADLAAAQWIDLVATLAYLRRDGRDQAAAAALRVRSRRPEFARHIELANRALLRNGLIDPATA